MRVLLTNDDGFDSVGMRVLRDVVSGHFAEVWVSAPARDCSAASRALSVRTPIKTHMRGEREFVVHGTPADSAVIGICEMTSTGKRPDLVISGINYGANTGFTVPYSGTIAAAAAAFDIGVPAIAISQQYNGKRCDNNVETSWQNSRKSVMALVSRLLRDTMWHGKCVMSINVPYSDVQGVKFAGHSCDDGHIKWDGPSMERREITSGDGRCVSYVFDDMRSPNSNDNASDTQLLEQGYIVVTPIGHSMTDHAILDKYCGLQ
ncbi:stationary-phase survival protein [Anaplasma marginale str. St. Maries]|uniref:5'-nucleotidase SurE n=1 Tax=Anaplasma marginale (strain St. Maries) TaxID=234826 RepID=SURE_ANAMM|nr:5'/3'-nucleotidase SurE [Anaplasma marginale]Q5PB34.1 RecName: Full=5'-nucleotidase SurE; AltName: Full=Nucleoside 5'-monophosphate phosphohydrolase [Anaplasma marginale str. St. Maries]AAV86496.1 stationary-phase survival protein [Anaplasma marginale str. St. Maries]